VREIIQSLTTAIESMLAEREDEIPGDVDPQAMVTKEVLKAVEERTGWKIDPKDVSLKSTGHKNHRKGCVTM